MTNANAEKVRAGVSRAYSLAARVGRCCGGAPEVPEGSFGCGDPLADRPVRPGDTVLDLGCGAGFDLRIAAERVGPTGRVIGVDMTDEMIERARRNMAALGLANVEVRKGIIEDLPVEGGSFDWVISNCVINLSPEKERVFAEIARVLKPGGRMSISDLVVRGMPRILRRSAALWSACLAGAVTEEEYLAGLRAAGLEDVRVTGRFRWGGRLLRAAGPVLGEYWSVRVEATKGAGAQAGRGGGR